MSVNPMEQTISGVIRMHEASRLIERIIAETGISHFPLIVEVGCGDGEFTNLLRESFNPSRILGIAVDPEIMAKNDEDDIRQKVVFVVSDISNPWVELDPLLHHREGTVDLVVSNLFLHKVQDSRAACRNMNRLLKPGGFMYFSNPLLDQITDISPEEEQETKGIDVLMLFDPYEIQMWKWHHSLFISAFENGKQDVVYRELNMTSAREFKAVLNKLMLVYIDKLPLFGNGSGDLEQMIFEKYFAKEGIILDDYEFQEDCILYYTIYHMSGQKKITSGDV